jgi:hypothetical protein
MKTKLFSLFIAVFLFSISGKSQTNAKTSVTAYTVISLIGPASPGADWATDTDLSTTNGDLYTASDVQFSAGEFKIRANHCWESACVDQSVNVYGWGPAKAVSPDPQGSGWPSGSGVSVSYGPNIVTPGGVWNVTFTLSTNSWSFTAGTPNPVIKISGSGVSASPLTMTTANGINYISKKVSLVPGDVQFEINGALYGAAVPTGSFPTGTADTAGNKIPVTTTGIDYDVTFDYSTGAYTFAVATFPGISLVGNALSVDGWPGQPNNPGPIDVHQMTTKDGVTYNLNNLPIIPGDCVFRVGNDWGTKYGDPAFPTGSGNGGSNITVPAGNAGTYNVTLNTTTKTYTFTKITYSIVGEAVGGWPGDPGNLGPIDTHQLSTVDGVNYTINNLVCTNFAVNGGAKFRPNNAWTGDWGGTGFPSGTKTGNNIPTVAGTYNLTVNVLTGAYDFGTTLAVKNFSAGSFKAYPNPTQNSWTISEGTNKITSVHVYDTLGRSVYAKATSSNDVSVNASNLSKGTYFAKVSTANGTSTVKLVKE